MLCKQYYSPVDIGDTRLALTSLTVKCETTYPLAYGEQNPEICLYCATQNEYLVNWGHIWEKPQVPLERGPLAKLQDKHSKSPPNILSSLHRLSLSSPAQHICFRERYAK